MAVFFTSLLALHSARLLLWLSSRCTQEEKGTQGMGNEVSGAMSYKETRCNAF